MDMIMNTFTDKLIINTVSAIFHPNFKLAFRKILRPIAIEFLK